MKVQEKEPLSPHLKQYQAIEAVFFMSCFSLFLVFFWILVGFTCKCKPRGKPENSMNTTVNVLCYKSKVLSNGEHPLMLRICKVLKLFLQ